MASHRARNFLSSHSVTVGKASWGATVSITISLGWTDVYGYGINLSKDRRRTVPPIELTRILGGRVPHGPTAVVPDNSK